MTRVREQAVRGSLLIMLFFIPFGMKKYITILLPEWYEYARTFSSLFVYATDILALFAIALSLWYWRKKFFTQDAATLALIGLLACAAISLLFGGNTVLSVVMFVRLLLAGLFAVALGNAIKEGVLSLRAISITIGSAAAVQGIVAIAQFILQRSIGLAILGESVITPFTAGVARVSIDGVSYLRAYGTLPHANILAAFLIFGTFAFGYLLSRPEGSRGLRVFSIAGLFLTLAGLALTFSRSGWIAAALSMCIVCVREVMHPERRTRFIRFLFPFFISLAALSFTLGWAVVPRAGFGANEPSVDHRILYNEIGISLLRSYPYGTGIGGEVLRAEKDGLFVEKGLDKRWMWQPIHNLYLLIATEIGIQGFIAWAAFLYLIRRAAGRKNEAYGWYVGVFSAFLIFGLFDHFFWDLEAGRLMFWSVLGIMMGLRATPS